ncbi:Capsule biosynthesis protein CapA [bacterium HR26]|nr:Capsule biosynthesis protein CapA [bacterium HR26]
MTSPALPTIGLAGDLMLRRPLPDDAFARRPGLAAAREAIRACDLMIANLEMPLSRRGYRVPKHSNLRSDPEVIWSVRELGVHAVTLANNHMMDYGPEAMFDTLAACDEAGIARCGAGADQDAALQPAWLTTLGTKIALLSVASTLPVESDAGPGKPGIAPLRVHFSFEVDTNLLTEQPGTVPPVRSWPDAADLERVCERVRLARREADLVIVGIHWGVPPHWLSPYLGLLAEYQRPVAHALIEAGADVIAGHHSHCLHPIEWYRGKPIFYSLGNFLFEDPPAFMEPESVLVRLKPGAPLVVELVPLLLDGDGFPAVASGSGATWVVEKLRAMSASYGCAIEERGGGWVACPA